MEGKTKCQDLYSRLKAEDPNKVWLCIILKKEMEIKQMKRGGHKLEGIWNYHTQY